MPLISERLIAGHGSRLKVESISHPWDWPLVRWRLPVSCSYWPVSATISKPGHVVQRSLLTGLATFTYRRARGPRDISRGATQPACSLSLSQARVYRVYYTRSLSLSLCYTGNIYAVSCLKKQDGVVKFAATTGAPPACLTWESRSFVLDKNSGWLLPWLLTLSKTNLQICHGK